MVFRDFSLTFPRPAEGAHPLDHLGDKVSVDVLVGFVAIEEFRVDGNPVIHAQEAVHQLFEVRSVILAESVGDHEGLVVVLPLVEPIFTVDLVAGGVVVHVGEVQVKALHDLDCHTPEHGIGPRIGQPIQHAAKSIIVEPNLIPVLEAVCQGFLRAIHPH